MDKTFHENFNYILSYLPSKISESLKELPENIVESVQEIRIRENRPVIIITNSECLLLKSNGKLSNLLSPGCLSPSKNEIEKIIHKMCDYSMHNHYEDIKEGYITLHNGARIGITGTAVYDKDKIKGIKDFDGLNIRIPRNCPGVSDKLFEYILNDFPSSILIAGPPSSGKTTMLKDVAYQISSGRLGKYYKTTIVDERKEIINEHNGRESVGLNTDVLYGFSKAYGISLAVRTLSPDYIICDEIGGKNEFDEILYAMNCGVKFIITVHAENLSDLKRKEIYKRLVADGIINNVVILETSEMPCTVSKIISNNNLIYERNSCNYNNNTICVHYNNLYEKSKVTY